LYVGLGFTITLTIVSILVSVVIAFLIQKFVPPVPKNELKRNL
jgi:hypothetical protein